MGNRGVEAVEETSETVRVRVAAGENWHQLVMRCLHEGWRGIENLALIPGSVGAAPVQNIGAYGVELSQVLKAVHVVDARGDVHELSHAACEFGYRDSIFKRADRARLSVGPEFVIYAVELQLGRSFAPVKDYPDVARWLDQRGSAQPSAKQMVDCIVAIRTAKLPDPKKYPNAGSFFKNPVVAPSQSARLRNVYPELQGFVVAEGVKLSAAQLIDLAGCKGWRDGPVFCWPRQPLVLVNQGGSAEQLLDFAEAVRRAVERTFEVQLELEPSLL